MLHDFSVGQYDNLIRMLDRRKTVRYDQHRSDVLHLFHGILDQKLGFGVDVRRRLVKDHDRRLMDDGTRKREKLALSGGFQDAYTYNCRDEVFSNAQTGNVVLMSQNFLEGNFTAGLRYLFPILFFAMGVFLAENFQEHYRYAKRLHWRQVLLAAEIVILAIVGFIPSSYNMLAAMLVSFACAIQVQTFRKVGGYSYASTMCIGNLRSGTAALSMYMRDKKKEQLRQAGYYFGVILAFAIGAGIGGVFSMLYGIHVIWISCGLLLVSFLLMSLEKYR